MADKKNDDRWSVWIDENKKTVTMKKVPHAKEVFFESRKAGIHKITTLVSKGYKIG